MNIKIAINHLAVILCLGLATITQASAKSTDSCKGCRNIISVNFPQFHILGGLRGLSGGFSFERYLNAEGTLSVEVPYLYHQGTNGNSGSLRGNAYYKTCYGHYLAPALYVHLFGNFRTNDIAMGVSVLAGAVQLTEHHNMNGSEVSQNTDLTSITGISGQLKYQAYIRKKFVFGTEIGFGTLMGSVPDHNSHLFHIGLKFGWRF